MIELCSNTLHVSIVDHTRQESKSEWTRARFDNDHFLPEQIVPLLIICVWCELTGTADFVLKHIQHAFFSDRLMANVRIRRQIVKQLQFSSCYERYLSDKRSKGWQIFHLSDEIKQTDRLYDVGMNEWRWWFIYWVNRMLLPDHLGARNKRQLTLSDGNESMFPCRS